MESIIIAAVAKNGIIGKGNDLPWNIPEDFKHFKETTKGHPVIMGRLTFVSMNSKPLPNRVNIVLSGKMAQPADKSFFVARSIEQALTLCKKDGFEKAFIIGGGGIYKAALEKGLTTRMILSEIKQEYEGDTSFPEWNKEEWKEVSREPHDEFDVVTYAQA
ncbi:dihydrofolate reductase [Candidatus Woesearchaeota archaeon]|nr:dihydrofolate reductase [Candidatus Woesearchaeota archaeon]